MNITKICSFCKVEKSTTEFYRDSKKKDGFSSQCKICKESRIDRTRRLEYTRNWRSKMKADPETAERLRNYGDKDRKSYGAFIRRLKKKYNLSLEDYERMIEDQNGKCFICGDEPETKRHQGLVVDHNHITGMVRQLLCLSCSQGIGYSKEDIQWLQNLALYLDKHVGI